MPAPEFAPVTIETLETWKRQRSDEELHSLLGKFISRIDTDSDQVDDDAFSDAALHDFVLN